MTVVALVGLTAAAAFAAQQGPVDTGRSSLTVSVFKAGVFSAFADNHVIRAPIASGAISTAGPLSVEIRVGSANLTVLDPDLSAEKRAKVQERMLGPEVLDTERYPAITFVSTAVEATAPDRWEVTGDLTIHGQTRPTTLSVAWKDGRYRGSLALRQHDFGIEPIRILGGAVKVKDELKIEFEIAVESAP